MFDPRLGQPSTSKADKNIEKNDTVTLKGARFESVETIKAKATEVLNQLTEVDFQHCFQRWKNRMERCRDSQGEHIEGEKVATDLETITAKYEQLPSVKKGSLSNSSSDYGLDESYNSADELTDSAFFSARTVPDPLRLPLAHSTPHNRCYITLKTHSTRCNTLRSRNRVITASQQSAITNQGANVVYARVQKEGSYQQPSPDPWGDSSNRPLNMAVGPPPSLAEQLKQVLAEREKRFGCDSINSSTDELNDKSKNDPAHHLLEEIRQAVNEANAKVKKVVPVTLSPPGSTPWQHQGSTSPTPPSPSSLSSGSVSPSRHDTSWATTDLSLSSCSISSDKRSSHFWQSIPVSDWSKEQGVKKRGRRKRGFEGDKRFEVSRKVFKEPQEGFQSYPKHQDLFTTLHRCKFSRGGLEMKCHLALNPSITVGPVNFKVLQVMPGHEFETNRHPTRPSTGGGTRGVQDKSLKLKAQTTIKANVCQWLLAIGMEQHVSKFAELQVNGSALLLLTSADFKILGITSEDKSRLKRKIKRIKSASRKRKETNGER
ncbi:hypothetical protein NQ318_012652 [Aromia moschata]|uniref:SAM domain-containing protein n=1 Tax=Aromia moschata TaxID=1265417 RepID=A0AAV8X6N0_9CUCU|nr:hypothetical protein NQ318_012652 [Aromia moschata]